MDSLILVTVGLLGLLAVFDLYVGVSNDAVNFLNSAVGSRTAPFRIIMMVASAGVLLGATFSLGMMDIAKSGVLVPAQFSFYDVLVIFSAVMVTDILLINVFNSLGLPTSTTVSIVFELLGGTATLAAIKVWSGDLPMSALGDFMNSAKALSMIMAILVSVAVAFVSGLVVQYALRLIFTFNYEKIYRRLGGLFGAVCVTAILYFLVMKGAKGASFVTPEMLAWLQTNESAILGTAFVLSFALMQGAILIRRANIFPFVILAGTFALAFAFAGNDLVNFVGVPLAALEAMNIFEASGAVDPKTFMMGDLAKPSTAGTLWLILSGLVMVATLWVSKKARRVIMTSVKLSSSSRGEKEQFGSSMPARVIVRSSLQLSHIVRAYLPASLMNGISSRYEPRRWKAGETELPFDEIRASVNLVLAAALIASATSLKLPLSTTYVTFMVAMGSSLADGAWDRESAVYRVSGVLTVISGWFLTALSAAGACALFTLLFYWGGEILMILGMIVSSAILVKTNFFSKDDEDDELHAGRTVTSGDRASILGALDEAFKECVERTTKLAGRSMRALLEEDGRALKEFKDDAAKLFDDMTAGRRDYYAMSRSKDLTKDDRDARSFYYRAFTNMKEVAHGLRDQVGVAENYVANSHSAFTGSMASNLKEIASAVESLSSEFTPEAIAKIYALIERAQGDYLVQTAVSPVSLRKSELFLGALIFTRELVNRFSMVQYLMRDLDRTAK